MTEELAILQAESAPREELQRLAARKYAAVRKMVFCSERAKEAFDPYISFREVKQLQLCSRLGAIFAENDRYLNGEDE